MTALPINAVAEPYIRPSDQHLECGALVIFATGTGQPYVTTDYPAVQRALEIRADVLLAAKLLGPTETTRVVEQCRCKRCQAAEPRAPTRRVLLQVLGLAALSPIWRRLA